MNVISSIPSLYNFQREGISLSGLLKRYAILFDQIIFNRHGAPISDGLIGSLSEFVSMFASPEDDRQKRLSLGLNRRFKSLFVDCWDMVSDVEKFESMRFQMVSAESQARLSDFCFSEIRRANNLPSNSYAFDIDDVNQLSGDLYADIGLNLLAVAEGLEVVPSYSPIIGRALANETQFSGGQCHELFNGGLLIPDFDEFTWDEILELRDDKYVKSFRNVVYELMNNGTSIEPSLQQRVQDDLWHLAADMRPNVRQSVLGAIGSNLPSPLIVNPIGVGLALKDIRDNRERENKYGHVFFIQKMRRVKS